MGDANIDSIFGQAVELADDAARSAFVDEACGDDAMLQSRVRKLLNAHFEESAFMNKPAGRLISTDDVRVLTVEAGTQIGPYKIREMLGEGGMGEVYVAEQTEPVRRKVALKIIKPGMATKDVVARFEAERQALAMMDHPNIAKVFDGGSTNLPLSPGGRWVEGEGAGQPYFVMELVVGVPITEYCDEHELTTRHRQELFLKICQAVHHAHQKGVIHRDIKPGNVLVAEIDGVAVPKVIDFGVAKAIDQKLTKDTLYTNVSQMIGTPLYMSPEQATLGVADVDTRSDVYSLGVLLYELLTGQTPFDRDTLKQAAFEEIQRIIREDEPPRPSAKVSTLKADALSTISAKRRSDPRRLGESLRGELDWIVMKALDKDRNRRYESPNDLARDVERFQVNEPVHACPPGVAYRARKFFRKHRTGVAAAAAVVLAITAGTVFASIGFARAVEERRVAENERDAANVERKLAKVQRDRACELVNDVLRSVAFEIQFVPHLQKVRTNLLHEGVLFFEGLAELSGDDPEVRRGLARALSSIADEKFHTGEGGGVEASRALEILLTLNREYPNTPRYRRPLADTFLCRARSYVLDHRWRDAQQMAQKALGVYTSVGVQNKPESPAQSGEYYLMPSVYAFSAGDWKGAADGVYRAIGIVDGSRANDDFHEMKSRKYLADILMSMGRFDEAREQAEQAYRIILQMASKSQSARTQPLYGFWQGLVGETVGRHLMQTGDHSKAETRFDEAISAAPIELGGLVDYIWTPNALGLHHYHRSELYALRGRTDEAVADMQRGLKWWQTHQGKPLTDYNSGLAHWRLGELFCQQGQKTESEFHLAKARALFEASAERQPDEPYCTERLVAFLSNCLDKSFRDPEQAVKLAQREQSPSNGLMWRYSALASYRAGDLPGAEKAIRTSMDLRNGGDAIDLLILAAAQSGLRKPDQAQATLAAAERAISNSQPIYYGTIGVIGFHELRTEIRQSINALPQQAPRAHDFSDSPD